VSDFPPAMGLLLLVMHRHPRENCKAMDDVVDQLFVLLSFVFFFGSFPR
jgi:hypothetical protein